MEKDILDCLIEYSGKDFVPMHMPGGKRNADLMVMDNPYKLDITEIDGFDNMHNPSGIIKHAFERCARVFGADETLFLVNGSSAGILAGICGATCRGDSVIVARNCHISVYNALYLNNLKPEFIYPEINEYGFAMAISPDQVEEALLKCNAKAVIITSPTYEGIVSDIEKIAEIAHKNGAVLIVDEAHGAHLHFHGEFPKSAVECGADIVVQSIHKTLPSLTQTALLHINGSIVNAEQVKFYWNIYQTTSPSYILMASIDRCVTMLKDSGAELFNSYVSRLKKLRGSIEGLKNIRLYPVDDISKIVLCCPKGEMLYHELLTTYHIQCEMFSLKYVVLMTSVADKDEYYDRVAEALGRIDCLFDADSNCCSIQKLYNEYIHEQRYSVYDAVNSRSEGKELLLKDAVNRVSAKKICLYPPGIPLIVEGEVFTDRDIEVIVNALKSGIEVIGITSVQNSTKDYKEKVGVLCLE